MNGETCRCVRPMVYNRGGRSGGLLWCRACDCRVADRLGARDRVRMVWRNDHTLTCSCMSCVMERSSRAYA